MDEAMRERIREVARETAIMHHTTVRDLIEAFRLIAELAAPHPWYFALRSTFAEELRGRRRDAYLLSLAEVLEVLEAVEL